VTFSPNNSLLASAGSNNLVKLWDVNTGELVNTFSGHTKTIHSLAFNKTGDVLISGGNNELLVWDVAAGKTKNIIVGDDKLYPRFGPIKAVAFNPNGKDSEGYEFAFTCYQGIALFNPINKKLWKLDDSSTPQSITFSPDGKYITWGARHHHVKSDYFPRFVKSDGKVKDFSISKDDELARADRVFVTEFTPDGNRLVMLTYDEAVLFDIKSGSIVSKFSGTSETSVTDAVLSPDGHLLAVSAKDLVKVWKID